jgi:hypothetical protein
MSEASRQSDAANTCNAKQGLDLIVKTSAMDKIF